MASTLEGARRGLGAIGSDLVVVAEPAAAAFILPAVVAVLIGARAGVQAPRMNRGPARINQPRG